MIDTALNGAFRIADRFVPEDLAGATSDDRRRARLVTLFSLALTLWGPVFIPMYLVLNAPFIAVSMAVTIAIIACAPFLLRWGVSPSKAAHAILAPGMTLTIVISVQDGGTVSPATGWMAALVVLALMLAGRRTALRYTAYAILALVGIAVHELTIGPLPTLSQGPKAIIGTAIGVASLLPMILSLAYLYEVAQDQMLADIAKATADPSHTPVRMVFWRWALHQRRGHRDLWTRCGHERSPSSHPRARRAD